MDVSLFSCRSPGQLVRIDGNDHSFVPSDLPPQWQMNEDIWPLLLEATKEIALLEGIGRTLPNPEILESYNYVVDGSAKMILEMFQNEQKHRHEWEREALKIHSKSTLLGQVLGFMIAIAIFGSATLIGYLNNNSTTPAFIWAFGLALVFMSGIVWLYAKSMGQRPLFGRPTMRAHFRPQKEQADQDDLEEK